MSYLSNLLYRRGFFLAIDINPNAARTTLETMRRNKVRGDVIQGDLVESVLPRLRGKLVSLSCRQRSDTVRFRDPLLATATHPLTPVAASSACPCSSPGHLGVQSSLRTDARVGAAR